MDLYNTHSWAQCLQHPYMAGLAGDFAAAAAPPFAVPQAAAAVAAVITTPPRQPAAATTATGSSPLAAMAQAVSTLKMRSLDEEAAVSPFPSPPAATLRRQSTAHSDDSDTESTASTATTAFNQQAAAEVRRQAGRLGGGIFPHTSTSQAAAEVGRRAKIRIGRRIVCSHRPLYLLTSV